MKFYSSAFEVSIGVLTYPRKKLSSLPVSLLIPALRGLSQKKRKASTQQSQRHIRNAFELHIRYPIRPRRPINAPTGAFLPNKSAGLSSRSCVTSQVLQTPFMIGRLVRDKEVRIARRAVNDRRCSKHHNLLN